LELTGLTQMLQEARAKGYAVGAFNFCNAETAACVVEEAVTQRSPALLIVGPWEIPLLGVDLIAAVVHEIAAHADVPVCLHLDHATDLELVEACLKAGFPSVMMDASTHGFEENCELTRAAAGLAHACGATVEGELGAVGRVDDGTPEGGHEGNMTDPDTAAEFVRRTGVDALAVGIGNAHGMYPQRPELDFERLAQIREAVSVPLVLHGGSGTPADQLTRAIELGIAKVNVASELSRAFNAAVSAAYAETEGKAWWAHALARGKMPVRETIARWMRQLGCVGRVA
jgi:tagatose 1,6-diphosphate aldolase GatY/KbaY